ncbi:MAG: hypothetical protein JW882_13550 [Deltaproteobacteria bacterium]|nr:hypothetical protein [Deltaproteobacteria bacterium]
MNRLKYILFFLCFMGINVFNLPNPAYCESSQNEKLRSDTSAFVVIKSNTFEIDNNKKTVTFSGDVDAKRDDFTIKCQKMILYYVSETGETDPNKSNAKVEQITASGKVQISRDDGSIASADKAIYYQDEEKLVLTGNPVIKRGEDFVEGAVITVYLKENRSVVEGSEGIKAKAVLIPSGN